MVIGIIGILAAIAVPAYSEYRRRAYDAAAIHDLGNAIVAEEAYYASHNRYAGGIAITGPGQVPVPGFVVSAHVELTVDTVDDSFVVTATSDLGTGVIYEFDSTVGVIAER